LILLAGIGNPGLKLTFVVGAANGRFWSILTNAAVRTKVQELLKATIRRRPFVSVL